MSTHSAMENLPKTFCFPNLRPIVDEFKGARALVHPMMDMAGLETLNWLSRYLSTFICAHVHGTLIASYENMDKRWFELMQYTRSDHFMALMYPDIDFDDLVLSMQYCCWIFFVDDVVDAGKLSQEDVRTLAQMVEGVLSNRPLGGTKPFPLVIQTLQVIWTKIRGRNRSCFERRFSDGWIDWAMALVQVNEIRTNPQLPDTETYKVSRGRTLCLDCAFAFGGFIQHLNIDDKILDSAEMKQFNGRIIKTGGFLNDIFSWNTEQSAGDTCNFVSLVMIQEKKTIQEAMDEAAQKMKSQAAKIRAAKLHVLEIYKEHEDIKDLKRLLESNECWLWAAVEWSFVAADRYFGSQRAAQEAQDSGIVHIMPRRFDETTPVRGM
ncbi:isoprenoid synthase domain-containing protein [Mycena capillaripes]|nr:isoprenoid synthase domain-containing protein [Mycena capillaripes]